MRAKCWNALAVFIGCATIIGVAPGQTFESLLNFDGANGAYPNYMSLVQGADGDFYGTTSFGGANYQGTVFSSGGASTVLYSFCAQANCNDGAAPTAGLTLGIDGNFYGTTPQGGTNMAGTVFKVTPAGKLTTLYSFCTLPACADGYSPQGGLVQATDGNFYGTTSQGGLTSGTIFKITSSGSLNTLHTFNSADGAYPTASLIQANDGNLYGTTYLGGTATECIYSGGCGTIFKVTLSGTLTTFYSFCSQRNCTDGVFLQAGVVQSSDGNFYGTTLRGGTNQTIYCYDGEGCGTVFKMTAQGTVTTLHSFDDNDDGFSPSGGLVAATDGNLYGTDQGGGNSLRGSGTVFQVTPSGTITILHTFGSRDGADPSGGLLQSTNGDFFGTTYQGGSNFYFNYGTVFTVSTGLGPFVTLVRNVTKVGQPFGVLGQGFIGTTDVSMNGASAPFTVKSDTLITATVPPGATSGPVTVTTPSGTLTSNVPFRVLPQLLSFTPASGPVGTQVTLTGVSFTQTTGVGFGDYTPAPFAVNSDTQVTATVPIGAKTGPVGIQTQGGIAISTQTFTVTQ